MGGIRIVYRAFRWLSFVNTNIATFTRLQPSDWRAIIAQRFNLAQTEMNEIYTLMPCVYRAFILPAQFVAYFERSNKFNIPSRNLQIRLTRSYPWRKINNADKSEAGFFS